MKVLITGAHFTPAIAVITQLQKRPGVEIIYLGRRSTREGDKTPSAESQQLPKMGVKFVPITTGRLQRTFTFYTVPSLLKIPIGLVQAFYYLVKEHPQVVLSFGGYVSVPTVICAWLLSIPVVIHEQTLVSGLANTVCSWFANKIAVSFETRYPFPKNKTVITGNPIRDEVLNPKGNMSPDLAKIVSTADQEKLPLILVTGGNQGSHIINQTIAEALSELTKIGCVIHQTGDSKFKDFDYLSQRRLGLNHPERYLVKKWIEAQDLGNLLYKIDLAISRAGANSLLELSLVGVPTVLIPLPFIHKDEQVVNARFFKEKGLAEVINQSDFNKNSLITKVSQMLNDLPYLKTRAKQAQSVVVLDGAEKLAIQVLLTGVQ